MATSLLKVERLNVGYIVNGTILNAVRSFSMDVAPGQVVGIVGESGSGKSTVARAIMRYDSPNTRIDPDSIIEFMGEDLRPKTPRQMRQYWGSKIAMVPQNPGAALNPALKIGEQLAEIARLHLKLSKGAARAKAFEGLERVGLPGADIARRYPHELSGGMQQRVVIAMALLTSPQLLILDEPTTNLDVTTEATILDLVRTLIAEEGTGAVYITHNMGVVAQLCERVIIMYGGEIMGDAPVNAMFDHPIHPYTIGLLRSIPRIGMTKRQDALQPIPGSPPGLNASLMKGCVYQARCPLALDICRMEKPPLEEIAPDRRVRCHRWGEIVNGLDIPYEHTSSDIADISDRENLLTVENLTKHFAVSRGIGEIVRGVPHAPVRAVDGVNLSIQKGRTLGLVGESGSGKSTLSRLIIGLTDRSDGTITLMGIDIQGDVTERSKTTLAQMQMVFQNPQNSLNPYRTVRQILERPLLTLRGMKRGGDLEKAVADLLTSVRLQPSYADRYPDELSGGEKQRIAIARAFASDPALIVCDEAVSALDVSVQAAIINLLAALQEERDTSYLFISHDLAVVGYLADYVAVMYLGQLFEVGYAHDVYGLPLHPYTEALLSSIPVPDPNRPTKAVRLREGEADARHIPSGCRFHTRCSRKIGAICEQEVPPWRDDGDGHFIRCHIPLDELVVLQKSAEAERG